MASKNTEPQQPQESAEEKAKFYDDLRRVLVAEKRPTESVEGSQPPVTPAPALVNEKEGNAASGKAAKAVVDPKQKALGLLANVGTKLALNPGQDFDGKILWYGIPAEGKVVLINSDREVFSHDDLPDPYMLSNVSLDRSRISRQAINDFLDQNIEVNGAELLEDLVAFFKDYVLFEDERIYALLSLWAVGTYCYTIFRVFPYLSLRSATKECGKSRTLDLLHLVCFNSDPRTTSPTEAILFRGPAKHGGTLLLDEIEGLTSDRDRLNSILSVLNSGFEQGGFVSRLERGKDSKFFEIKYPTYCPKAIAGINKLADTLEGRSITLYLKRKRSSEIIKRLSPTKQFQEMQPIRDRLYIWCLNNAGRIAEIYQNEIFLSHDLDCLGDRDRDLWEPLIAIAMAAGEGESQGDILSSVVSLARELSQAKYQVEDENISRLIGRLESILGEQAVLKITPTDLLSQFKTQGLLIGSANKLARLLAPLGLKALPEHNPKSQKTERLYTLTREGVDDLKVRYLRPDSHPYPSEERNNCNV